MFWDKCLRCGKRVSRSYDFCPKCGLNMKPDKSDGGFLGKYDLNSFEDFNMKMPFGFNTIFKSLTKELAKQMNELDKELKNEKENKNGTRTNFSITIGGFGGKPIRISGSGNPQGAGRVISAKPVKQTLPKISADVMDKLKKLKKKEPVTNIRRFSDRIVYELEMPGVDSVENININQLEEGLEIKAFSKKDLFVKNIKVALPLLKCALKDEMLILELGLKGENRQSKPL